MPEKCVVESVNVAARPTSLPLSLLKLFKRVQQGALELEGAVVSPSGKIDVHGRAASRAAARPMIGMPMSADLSHGSSVS